MGFLQDLSDPIRKKIYYQSVLAILSILTTFFMLFEMFKLFIQFNPFSNFNSKLHTFRKEIAGLHFFKKVQHILYRLSHLSFLSTFLRSYKTNFLAKVFNEYISKFFIIFVYIEMMPFFRNYALFSISNTWWGWLYAYLMWELTYWIWHYLGHRVRLFWCLHAPHHAPAKMNLTVAWVHFFAEGYYTAAIQVPLLMLLGVRPEMVAIILVIDGTWGTFIHCGEDAFKNGKLGWLEKIFITPSHHRVHHSSNPEYLDKNYGDMLIIWDKIFGTFVEETVEPKYGLTKSLGSNSFLWQHFHYFLELGIAYRLAKTFKEKINVIFGSPSSHDPRIRTLLERKLSQKVKHIAYSSKLIVAIQIKTITTIIVLFVTILFSKHITSTKLYLLTLFILLSVIITGAMLEQKRWIFHLEFIRFCILCLVFNTVLYLSGFTLVLISLGILYYKSINSSYQRFLFSN